MTTQKTTILVKKSVIAGLLILFTANAQSMQITASKFSVVNSFEQAAVTHFSTDGGTTALMPYNSSGSGDLGDWAIAGANGTTTSALTNLENSFDAFNYASALGGPASGLTQADIVEMRALGYTDVPLPSAAWLFLTFVLGLLFLKRKSA